MLARLASLTSLATTLGVLTIAAPAAAQNEAALKSFFEGKRITLRMDMPGSADGVDIRLEPAAGINFAEYRNDLRRYGTSIHAGEQSTITLIKLKKDLIEFQIGGGGFGSFGDDTSASSGIQMLDKTEREKTLERQIRTEQDRDRKRSLERELSGLRDRRERENRRLRAQSEQIEAMNRERIAQQRLTGGSRFNLRWSKAVPTTLRPDGVVSALVEYVDFKNQTQIESRGGFGTADLNLLRKGMSRADAEAAFGPPVDRTEKRATGVGTLTLVFDLPEQRITGDFVEGVLVRYTVTSK